MPHSTGIFTRIDMARTMTLVGRLQPEVRRIVVVSGASAFDKSYEDIAREQFAAMPGRLEFTYWSGLAMTDLLARVKTLPPDAALFYVSIAQDGTGARFLPDANLAPVVSSASVPTYTWNSVARGRGIIGGSLMSNEIIAERLGDLAVRLLRGETPESIPIVEIDPYEDEVDWRQLLRWNISEARLPQGVTVRFREPSLWNRYKGYVVAAVVLLALQTALIGALLVNRARRRRVENALRESEERFRVMADTAPMLVWRSNANKECDFFNQAWLLFRGRTFAEELGYGWAQGVHSADLERCLLTYTRAFDAREPFRMEYRLLRADGQYRWVLDIGVPRIAPDGQFEGYIGSCVDITDRRDAEEALHESERRYALATAAGGVGVWDWNLETNEIYIDPELKRILGFDDAEIRNHIDDWGARVHPDDREAVMIQAQACIDGRVEAYEVEHRMLHKNGGVRWFLARGSIIRQSDGSAHRMVGTDTDITHRKQAEAELLENEAALRKSFEQNRDLAGRLIAAQEAERTRIARDLHDDVSQQLAALAIALSGVRRRINQNETGRDLDEALTMLQHSTVTLAQDIRSLSHQLHPGVLQHAGLVAALKAHCAEFQRLQGVAVTFGADDGIDTVTSDVALCFYRVTQEALTNTARHARARSVQVQLTRQPDSIRLAVEDDGVGFEPTRRRNGGLGLRSIDERVRVAKGTFALESQPGRGTRLTIQIPLSAARTIDRIGQA